MPNELGPHGPKSVIDCICISLTPGPLPKVDFKFAGPDEQEERSLKIDITTGQECDDINNPRGRIVNYNLTIQCENDSNCLEGKFVF